MAFISYGRIDKKLFLVLAIIVLKIIDSIINKEVPYEYINGTLYILEEELGPIIIGIILLFVFRKQTKEKKESKEDKKSIKYILILIISRGFKTCYDYFYLFIVQDEIYSYYCLLNTTNGIEIITITILAYLLLKKKFYGHHKIFMAVYCASGITIDIILGNYKIPNYTYIATYIVYICNEVFLWVYIKYMIDKLYYNYIEILIYWGLIGLSFKLFYLSYVLIYEIKNETSLLFEDLYEYFTETNIFVVIFFQFFYYLSFFGLTYLLLILIIYYLQPNHIIINDEFTVFETNMFYVDTNDKYYTLIPFAFQVLALLFYFEILEFNFCKLNKNTAKNIRKRVGNDVGDDDIGTLIKNDNIDLPGGQYEYELDSLEGDASSL